MKKYRIVFNFSKFREAELETLGNIIVTSMNGNVYFLELAGDVANVQALVGSYKTALVNAADGGAIAIAIKDQIKEALKSAYRDLALKVMIIAKGDRAVLESSGFPLLAGRNSFTRTGSLDKVTGLTVELAIGQGAVTVRIS